MCVCGVSGGAVLYGDGWLGESGGAVLNGDGLDGDAGGKCVDTATLLCDLCMEGDPSLFTALNLQTSI